ncbi:hypothetical protein N7532_003035 [Penicillium argentinense]|uniref:Conidiation protein Con-6 n=1 Tax=Penicillium argentinense TaxID=1131581 RepID=A0A9W9FLM7_9EURO|nr:uncharacterized protein N7532_003035 [Penicillium argentinense]KAJ5102506.1 hypothetical protein N7532_003035 [Penicillium argentinense]
MSQSPANDEVEVDAEERVSAMRSYQAVLKNPRVSDKAKHEASDVLNNELGWDTPRREVYAAHEHPNPSSVAASMRALNPHGRNHERAAEL